MRTEGPQGPVRRLKVAGGALWAIVEDGLWRMTDRVWARTAEGAFVDLCEHLGDVILASAEQVYRLDDTQLVPLIDEASRLRVLGVASYAETLYVPTRQTDRIVAARRIALRRRRRLGTPADRCPNA